MTIIASVIVPNCTSDQYDEVRAKDRWTEDTPAGGLAHLTWFEGGDCYNLDAWESEAALNEFAEKRLAPAMAAAGLTSEPRITIYSAHEVFLPKAVTITAT